ncbi:MAG: UvrD-helicase domain-containing protein [Gammaproteobacteria bacterium]
MADMPALDPARSVSLQASAGSGKTWQLVSRIARLLLAGAEPGGIIALTFTRKAAVEMRLRLNERLRRLSLATEAELREELERIGLPADAARLERARGLYRQMLFAPYPPRAMTLHAFCQELLARFAIEARVPPDFSLYDNEVELADRSWRRLQSRITDEPESPAAQALRALVGLDFNEWTLRELVDLFLQHRGDWWAHTEDQADPVAFAAERLRGQLGDCDLERALREVNAGAFTARLRMVLNYVERCGGTRYIDPEPFARALLNEGALRFDALEQALYTQKGTPFALAANDGKLKVLSAKEREHFLETHEEVIREFEEMRRRRHAGETLARSQAAFTLGAAALEALREELAREHALGFTELEWETCKLLRRDGAAEWVRYRLDRRVDHLLVDEFQDTSPTQWRLLLPLLDEMAAGEGRASSPGRSLFIVGDAKQSIYSFRRADPRLLGRATGWMQQRLGAITAPLHHSRRSAPAIIDFVNALFAQEELGGRIGFERHDTHRKDDWGRVEVAQPVAEGEAADEDEGAFRDPLGRARIAREDMRAQLEARQVSARIRALVQTGIEVTTQHQRHPLGFGDIMVLARARTHLHHLERQLTADGIPFVGAARGTLLETSIARDLTALLQLLDASHRSLDLAQVLRSPLFGAGEAPLVALAADVKAHPGSGWFDALGRLAGSDPLLRRAHILLTTWRELSARLPAHDLLDRIARDTDAAARYEAALPRVTAARARANLGAFLQLALEVDSGRYPSLPRFLQWLDSQRRLAENAPDEPPPAAVTEHVRIMTIHAAKGLEAPAVFLFNAGSALSPRTPRLLIEWPEDAPRPTHFAVAGPVAKLDALGRALADRHKQREAGEELHVLYVAATRARHFLHVSGFASRSSKSWHGYAQRAMETLPPATPLAGTAPGSQCYAVGTPREGAPMAASPAVAADPRLRQALQKGDAHLFPLAPSKRTDEKGVRPHFETLEAADRGTAIHCLLQRLSEGIADEERLSAEVRARLGSEPAREDLSQWLADARALLAAPALAAFFDPARHARAWNEVTVSLDGQPGTIDRLVDDGHALWVLDYKTHARPQAAELLERYRAQLGAYVAAVAAVWPGRPVRAGLVLTATRSFVPLDA